MYVEYITGSTLGRRLRRWGLTTLTQRLVVVFTEMAEALGAARLYETLLPADRP